MTIRVRRMGDDGDGTTLNAEVLQRSAEVHFTGADVKRAFAELHALETNPWEAVEAGVPGLLAQVSGRAPAYAFEKGFRLELDVTVRGGNPTDPETVAVLYETSHSTGYQSTVRSN